ncbi:MAG: fumarylacetoacetate hydrolase family protein [Rhodospirillales bacterium]|jgi:2-keto-4-pentenoate hydratase/2-oxohepta-3-ene-1,7-dioic acid hydratase in catechol pathway
MRLVTFQGQSGPAIGVRLGDKVIDLSKAAPDLPIDMIGLLEGGESSLAKAKAAANNAADDAKVDMSLVKLLVPIARPGKIVCIGRNYAAHAAEGGAETPTYPEVFYRGSTTLIAQGEPIIRPKCSDKLDFEAELVVVIGKLAKHVAEADAGAYIAGYSLFNEGTLRDYQRKSSQWTVGKNFDNTGPFGPEIVTSDEVPEGAKGLRIQSRLNGQIMQDANTDDLVFTIHNLIYRLTECMTLEPGDIIVSGTPAGVGYARTPPVFMKPGDIIEIEVDGIGVLTNTIEDEK